MLTLFPTRPSCSTASAAWRNAPVRLPGLRLAPRTVGRILAGVGLLFAGAVGPAPAHGGKMPFLLTLPGVNVTIRYLPGSLDRASHAQFRFELLASDYQQWTKAGGPINLWVLDREAWEGLEIALPYGLPARVGDAVVLAAAGDEGTVSLWRGLVGDDLPISATGSGMAIQSTPSEVGSLAMNDIMAELEVSRLLVERSEFHGEVGWIDDLIVHVVAATAFLRHENARMTEIELVFDHLLSLRGGPLDLIDGRAPPDLALESWLAYQGRYFTGARLIAEKDGLAAVKKLYKLTKKGDRPVTLAALLDRYPELSAWFMDSFRAVE